MPDIWTGPGGISDRGVFRDLTVHTPVQSPVAPAPAGPDVASGTFMTTDHLGMERWCGLPDAKQPAGAGLILWSLNGV